MATVADGDVRELIEHWRGQCNRYANGQCHTRGCLVRGGYTDGPPDYSTATCEVHETVAALERLTEHKTFVAGVWDQG